MLIYLGVEFPDICEECQEGFNPDQQRIGVLTAREGRSGAVESLSAVCMPSSYHLHCAPAPGTPGRVIGGIQGRRPRKDSHGPNHFAEVAEVYRQGMTSDIPAPTTHVATTFSVSRSTAAKWVTEARRLGLLGPTRAGIAGG